VENLIKEDFKYLKDFNLVILDYHSGMCKTSEFFEDFMFQSKLLKIF